LLSINFCFYLMEDFGVASQVLRGGGTWLQWTNEFSTSLDVFGWLGLLMVFELDTYLLSDENAERALIRWSLNAIRLICYVLLIHTVVARVTDMMEYVGVEKANGVTSLCQLAEQEFSFTENNIYTPVNASNCNDLAQGQDFYLLKKKVVTDKDGYSLEGTNLWIDLQDVLLWLLIIAAIEMKVYLQNRGITEGRMLMLAHVAKFFYGVLFIHAGFWIYTGHWLWAWDQSLWIMGFWAIENNLSTRREEMLDDKTEIQGPSIRQPS